MARQPTPNRHRPLSPTCRAIAADQLARNSEALLWAAHVRAAELIDAEPGPVSRAMLNAVDAQWEKVFCDLPF